MYTGIQAGHTGHTGMHMDTRTDTRVYTHKQPIRHIDIHAAGEIWTGAYTHRLTYGHTDIQTCGHTDIQTYGYTDTHTYWCTDIRTDGQSVWGV